jgi:hypothetical protein
VGIVKPRAKGTLGVAVAPASIDRVMRILDTLLKAFESRDMKVIVATPDRGSLNSQSSYEGKTVVSVLDESFEINLEEQVERKERKIDTGDKEKPPGYRWHDSFEYEDVPTGRLSLKIKNVEGTGVRRTWSDTNRKPLEKVLNSIVAGLMKAAVDKRARRLEREREERERIEHQRKAEEQARLRREEEKRIKILMEQVTNWHESQKIRQYIEAFRALALWKHGSIEPGSELDKWITWATRQANRLDPLLMNGCSIINMFRLPKDDFQEMPESE